MTVALAIAGTALTGFCLILLFAIALCRAAFQGDEQITDEEVYALLSPRTGEVFASTQLPPENARAPFAAAPGSTTKVSS